jgi:hypothetical protein
VAIETDCPSPKRAATFSSDIPTGEESLSGETLWVFNERLL